MATYADRAAIENLFGKGNVRKWASLESTASRAAIAARIVSVLAEAVDVVNGKLSSGPYGVPFEDLPDTHSVIQRLTARIAGVLLYEARGVEDEQTEDSNASIKRHWQMAMDQIHEINKGGMRLVGLTPTYESVPEVITE